MENSEIFSPYGSMEKMTSFYPIKLEPFWNENSTAYYPEQDLVYANLQTNQTVPQSFFDAPPQFFPTNYGDQYRELPVEFQYNEEYFMPIEEEEERQQFQEEDSPFRKEGKAKKGLEIDLDDYEYIDTEQVCRHVMEALDAMKISQSAFAENVIHRTQGTLSDILRCPRPWSELKSGRRTYIKMVQWLELPESERLAMVLKGVTPNSSPEKRKPSTRKRKAVAISSWEQEQAKRKRVTFTPFQKNGLDAMFKEVKCPNAEVKAALAERLGLHIATVNNFFMNERRRTKRMRAQHEDSD